MAEPRSVMKEYRALDRKRAGAGLTPAEEARYAELRDLVEVGSGPASGGFDVDAAAARLRESLLPAGSRERAEASGAAGSEPAAPGALAPDAGSAPPEPPEAEAAAPEAAFEVDAFDSDALLDSLVAETPPAEQEAGGGWAAAPGDAAWGSGAANEAAQSWDPNMPEAARPWDPDAPPNDPTQPWDPNAVAYDANGQPYDPNAVAYDANGQPYDPNAVAYDADGQPYYPNAVAYDADGRPYDPNAVAYDGQPYDPAAAPLEPAQPDASSAPTEAAPYEPEPLQPESADAGWGGPEPFETTLSDAAQPGSSSARAGWDPGALVDGPELLDGAAPWSGATDAVGSADGWEATSAVEPSGSGGSPSAAEDGFLADAEGAPVAPAAATRGDPSPLPPPGWSAEPEPPAPVPVQATELGEYDESGGAPAAFPPEDADFASMLPPESSAEEEGGELAGELAGGGAPSLGEYDDTAGFGRSLAIPPPDLVEDGSGFHAAPTFTDGEPAALAPGNAFEDPFELAAGSSFDARAAATVPEWAGEAPVPPWEEPQAPDAATATGTEDFTIDFDDGGGGYAPAAAPAAPGTYGDLGLDAEGDLASGSSPDQSGAAPALDFSRPDLSEGAGDHDPYLTASPALTALAALELEGAPPAHEELPTIEGAEILEEIPEGAPAPAQPPDLTSSPVGEGACRLAGVHRVVIHTIDGQVKRGVVDSPDLGAATLALAPQPGGPSEALARDRVKAIFFMLSPGEAAPPAEGKKVRVTFADGREVTGFRSDHDESGPGFFMVPAEARTSTRRIWIYRAAARAVSVT